MNSREKQKVIRLALVAPSLRKIGGQSVQAALLMRKWNADSEVDPLFVPIDPGFPFLFGWVERVPFLRTIFRVPFYSGHLARAVVAADLVHVFAASYWSFMLGPALAWVFARILGKKVLIHYHSGEARDHLERSAAARHVLRRSDARAVPSDYLQIVFEKFDLDCEIVPNVVDEEQFHFRVRESARPILICTRGFEPYYAVDDVVRAFAYVIKVFPEAELLLVGSGSQENLVRELVAQLGLVNVKFLGKIANDQIASAYDQADIFINASWVDNMPVSILEAFASGTPVVSTAPEGIRHLVKHGETGLLSEPHDWNALGENVLSLVRHPEEAARLAQNAREKSRAFQWGAVRGKWLDLYRSTLGAES